MLGRVIVRLPNWLGDTVMAVPALRALRAGAPANLLLAGPWVSVLAGQGLGDVLVDYPRSWAGRLRTADTVRRFGADLAVVLPGSLESALAAWYWAPRRVGIATGGRAWLLTHRVPPTPRRHQVDAYLAVVEALGLAAAAREPRLTPPAPDSEPRVRARALLAAGEAGRGRRIGVHLGAAYGPAKTWVPERVGELCARLRARGDAPVLLGAPADAPLAAALAARTGAAALAGRDTPELLPAVLAELDALVSGDTGVGHLAAALGLPVVALFGPTDPALTAPRGRVAVVQHPVPCAPCFYRRCPIDHPCMRGIEADEVTARLDALLSRAA